jgi:hypothetical protein
VFVIKTYRVGGVDGDGGDDGEKLASRGLLHQQRPVVYHLRDLNPRAFHLGFELFGHRVVAPSTLLA